MRSSSMRFAPHSTEPGSDCGNAERVSRSPHFRDYFPRGRGSWRAVEAGCPIKAAGIGGPCLKRASRAATAEFRVVDLISHHDVSADEKFSGGGHFGLWPAAALRQTLIETL